MGPDTIICSPNFYGFVTAASDEVRTGGVKRHARHLYKHKAAKRRGKINEAKTHVIETAHARKHDKHLREHKTTKHR